jgi:hypothetical protein
MLKIIKINTNILNDVLNNLPKSYLKSLENKENFEESIVARYIIFKEKNILVEF